MTDQQNAPPRTLKDLHDRLGLMIDQVGQPDYSMREFLKGVYEVRNDLLTLSETARTYEQGLEDARQAAYDGINYSVERIDLREFVKGHVDASIDALKQHTER